MKKIKTNDKQILKMNFAKATKTAGTLALVAAIWLGAGENTKVQTAHAIGIDEFEKTTQQISLKTTQFSLPSQEEVRTNLQNYFSEETVNFNLHRLALPKNSKSIKINFTFNTTPAQRELFQEAIDEFNNVFAVINSSYHFEANFSPSNKDIANIYNINVEQIESFEDENIYGLATSVAQDESQEIEGKELYSNKIQLAKKAFLSSEKLLSVFKHEFMHPLGADDIKEANFTTIMENLSENSFTHLTSNDVAFLASLYKSTSAYTDEEIENFIDTYEICNAFSWSISKSKLAQQFNLENLYNSLTSGEINSSQLYEALEEKYSNKEISILQQLLENKGFEIYDFSENTTLCELFQKKGTTSIHRFAEISQGTLVVHNFRDIDPTKKFEPNHFETTLSNMTTYKGIFGDDTTAYINLGELVLQVEYSIDDQQKLKLSPLAVYQKTNLSKEEYSQEIAHQQGEEKENIHLAEITTKDF